MNLKNLYNWKSLANLLLHKKLVFKDLPNHFFSGRNKPSSDFFLKNKESYRIGLKLVNFRKEKK